MNTVKQTVEEFSKYLASLNNVGSEVFNNLVDSMEGDNINQKKKINLLLVFGTKLGIVDENYEYKINLGYLLSSDNGIIKIDTNKLSFEKIMVFINLNNNIAEASFNLLIGG